MYGNILSCNHCTALRYCKTTHYSTCSNQSHVMGFIRYFTLLKGCETNLANISFNFCRRVVRAFILGIIKTENLPFAVLTLLYTNPRKLKVSPYVRSTIFVLSLFSLTFNFASSATSRL